jgi:hypothetical protein
VRKKIKCGEKQTRINTDKTCDFSHASYSLGLTTFVFLNVWGNKSIRIFFCQFLSYCLVAGTMKHKRPPERIEIVTDEASDGDFTSPASVRRRLTFLWAITKQKWR